MIAITPVVAPPPGVQVRPVRLVDAWSDLLTDTTTNLHNIISGADSSAISQVFSDLLTNPLGVIGALANITPTVTTDLTSLPATISVELPPGLELAIAGLGATGATATAVENVVQQAQTNPSALYEGIATILNAYLNGQDNISLLDGAITIPLYNGLLAPETPLDVNINLTSLIDALGLGNTSLSNLDLSSLLSQLGLGDLTLGSLFSDLGLSGKGLGDLLGDPSLGTLLNDLGLGGLGADGLGLGSFSLTTLLTDLGLNSSLGAVTLTQVLDALGLNTDVGNLGLTGLISDLFPNGINVGSVGLSGLLTDLGLGSDTLGTLLGSAGIADLASLLNAAISGPLNTVASALNLILGPLGLSVSDLLNTTDLTAALDSVTLSTLVNDLTLGSDTLGTLLGSTGISDLVSLLNTAISGPLSSVATELNVILAPLGLSVSDLLNTTDLTTALDSVTLTQLVNGLTLGNGGTLSLTQLLDDLGLGSTTTGDLGSITTLLGDLGIPLPSTGALTISDLITDVLHELNVNIPATGDISLASLLTDLGGLTNSILDTNVGSFLNTLNLGDLLGDLGLSNLPLNLSDLGDLSNLTLGDLLGDLGLGDLANISVEPIGGFYTDLVDFVPQQILAAL